MSDMYKTTNSEYGTGVTKTENERRNSSTEPSREYDQRRVPAETTLGGVSSSQGASQGIVGTHGANVPSRGSKPEPPGFKSGEHSTANYVPNAKEEIEDVVGNNTRGSYQHLQNPYPHGHQTTLQTPPMAVPHINTEANDAQIVKKFTENISTYYSPETGEPKCLVQTQLQEKDQQRPHSPMDVTPDEDDEPIETPGRSAGASSVAYKRSDTKFERGKETPIICSVTKELKEKAENDPQKRTAILFFDRDLTMNFLDYEGPFDTVQLPSFSQWKRISSSLLKLKKALEYGQGNHIDLLVSTITEYCGKAKSQSNYSILKQKELQECVQTALPTIIDLALLLPRVLKTQIPILRKGTSKTIYVTRLLAASLLANGFLCTYPKPSGELFTLNFCSLFNYEQGFAEVKTEKLKCIVNYFIVLDKSKDLHNQVISFERRCMRSKQDWLKSRKPLCPVLVDTQGRIEEAVEMLQVDFANKSVGGGVLNNGMAQEEIRFCISPELILSKLFFEPLDAEEVVVITGSKVYSNYSGYSANFTFQGKAGFCYENKVDNLGRTFTQIVAMDAIKFNSYDAFKQYEIEQVNRELHKSYVGFMHGKNVTPVATGNWGCGIYNGNPEIKFLIQWMAASQQDRPFLKYFVMRNDVQKLHIENIVKILQKKNITVGQLYASVAKFSSKQRSQSGVNSIFDFVIKQHSSKF